MPKLSIIIPTRSRAQYLIYTLNTLVDIQYKDVEFVVLDNASIDDTFDVVHSLNDSRIRYFRSEMLLSMRNNFERGFDNSSGEIICFIGDDDGLFPDSIERVVNYFETHDIDAVMSNHARYYWPDAPTNRRNCTLISRRSDEMLCNSKELVTKLPELGQYMKLPCMYYGFVKRSVYERVIRKQGRFFMSNMPDVYSSIALSMENIDFLYTNNPLCMAGVSGRSNGGRADSTSSREEYLKEWKSEDDVGFISGFEAWKTINLVILEQGIRYAQSNPPSSLSVIFDKDAIQRATEIEVCARGRIDSDMCNVLNMLGTSFNPHFFTAKVILYKLKKLFFHIKTFAFNKPYEFNVTDVANVQEAIAKLYRTSDPLYIDKYKDLYCQLKTAIKFIKC